MESSIKIKIENVDCSDFRIWTIDVHEALSELYSAK